jgi:hypothetical protein
MIFEVGKVYMGYEVTGRTKCFVTYGNAVKKKVRVLVDRTEYTDNLGDDGSIILAKEDVIESAPPIETESAEVTAPNTHTWIEPSPNQIDNPTPVSGAKDGENIIVIDSTNQQWLLVAADTQTVLFEAVEHREIGSESRTRTMPLSEVQALYGWGEQKEADDSKTFNVGQTYDADRLELKVTSRTGDTIKFTSKFTSFIRHASVDDNGEFVLLGTDRSSKFYAVDTPKWFYGDDIDIELERERMARMWARDSDRERVEFTPNTYDLTRY